MNGIPDDCGCAMGARFVTIYAVAAPFLVWGAIAFRHWSILTAIVVCVIAFIPVAGTGKALGMALARMHARRMVSPAGGDHA